MKNGLALSCEAILRPGRRLVDTRGAAFVAAVLVIAAGAHVEARGQQRTDKQKHPEPGERPPRPRLKRQSTHGGTPFLVVPTLLATPVPLLKLLTGTRKSKQNRYTL